MTTEKKALPILGQYCELEKIVFFFFEIGQKKNLGELEKNVKTEILTSLYVCNGNYKKNSKEISLLCSAR